MAYVALSRVVSLQNTRVLSFDPAKVTANPKVVAFYKRLEAQAPPALAAPAEAAAASRALGAGARRR